MAIQIPTPIASATAVAPHPQSYSRYAKHQRKHRNAVEQPSAEAFHSAELYRASVDQIANGVVMEIVKRDRVFVIAELFAEPFGVRSGDGSRDYTPRCQNGG